MLTNICQYLRNWFDKKMPKIYGEFTIQDGAIVDSPVPLSDVLKQGQYIRVVKSALNDGVHTYPSDESFEDEMFTGAIWGMAIPKDVITLANEIQAWQEKYGGADSVAMSPYQSESFGGYSYSKGGGTGDSGYGVSWSDVFAKRLSPWRKI